jgi:Lipocalin-like domain
LAARVAGTHPSMRLGVAALVLVSATACTARRSAAPWVGTWSMTAVENRDSATGPWRQPFGEAPFGYVTYNADGTHTMNFTRTPVEPMFAAGGDRGASEAELRRTYEGYFSWFGRYTVDPARGIIIHRIEGSLWPSWRNTVQERPFVIRGDTLFLGDQVRSRRVLVRVR